MSQIVKAIIIERSAVTLLARIRDNEGDYIQTSNISTVTCNVFDLDSDTPATAVAAPTLVKADVIFNALVTSDPRWDVDATGYNFAAQLSGTNFGSGDHTYQVEVTITPTNGQTFRVVYQLRTENIFSE